MITFRLFEPVPAEYETVVAVRNACWPDYPETVEEFRHWDETRDQAYFFERWVAVKDGVIVALGACGDERWAKQPGKYFLGLDVHPDHRRQGIRGAFYKRLMAQLAEQNASIVVAGTRENRPDAVRFLENRGFVQEMRDPVSELDLAKFDWSKFEGARERMAAQEIKIHSLAELSQMDPDWKRRMYDLESILLKDLPSTDPVTPLPFDEYERQMFSHPAFNPDSQFVALHDDEWVGYSGLWISTAMLEKLFTGLTGVKRDYRRKGIARALKLCAIEWAQKFGAKVITTDNEENNPMFQINLQLGFEAKPAWLFYRKVIAGSPVQSDS